MCGCKGGAGKKNQLPNHQMRYVGNDTNHLRGYTTRIVYGKVNTNDVLNVYDADVETTLDGQGNRVFEEINS